MNFDIFDFMFCPEPTHTFHFKPVDIDVKFTSRSTTDNKEKKSRKSVDEFETKQSTTRRIKIKDVIFSNPATVVFWSDGTKTVVKARGGEEYDKEKGLAMAIVKKLSGNTRDYYNLFMEWCKYE